MAFVPTDLTKSASTPFKLLDSAFPVLRNFLDIMPMTSLFFLRQESNTVKSMSRFRGKIVYSLSIVTDTVEPWDDRYELYSNVIQRPYNVTPCCLLEVHMGPDICPKAVLSKMNEQSYTRLDVGGDYDWKQVVSFLHAGISNGVRLYDDMDLPETDMEEFFKILASYKFKE
uniref:DUF4869 domain-containing protein n=1 Tax=Panagrellus redivivus TaxID=6233 RepID=A0A7E4VT30_PANRE